MSPTSLFLAVLGCALTLTLDFFGPTLLCCCFSSTLQYLVFTLYCNTTHTMAPKDTELYDLLGVKPEATDIEYVVSSAPPRRAVVASGQTDDTG